MTYWWSHTHHRLFEPNVATFARRWAVILCRFKGLPGDSGIENLVRGSFTPGSGGLIEYWHDASLGAVDIGMSQVFGWIELDLPREKANIGSGMDRTKLVEAAIAACQRDHRDPVTGFHAQMAVFTHNFSKDGAPPGADYRDPVWGTYWIDGSSAGQLESIPPQLQTGSYMAHEMGHGLGLQHDLAANLTSEYGDPYCIMSAGMVLPFTPPAFGVTFGPSLSFSQLVLMGWMYNRRIQNVDAGLLGVGASIVLAALADRTAPAPLGAIVPNDLLGWSYHLEYVRPIGWNQGAGEALVVRRLVNNRAAFLGSVALLSHSAAPSVWVEPSGNVEFQIERADSSGRLLNVKIRKLI